jgi:hypothetical protein
MTPPRISSSDKRGSGIGTAVPWNASWTSEVRFEIRPCRWANGMPAIWSPHSPGVGRPIFAKPHPVRGRQSIAKFICTVCGEPTPAGDRWWFGHGAQVGQYWMTNEAPVHKACAEFALTVCPHLKERGGTPTPFPAGHSIACSLIGGDAVARDFGLKIPKGREVVGALKFTWPVEAIVRLLPRYYGAPAHPEHRAAVR